MTEKNSDDGKDGCNDNYDDNDGNFDDNDDKNDWKTYAYCDFVSKKIAILRTITC